MSVSPSARRLVQRVLVGIVIPVVVVVLWQILCQRGVFPSDLLPAPSAICQAFLAMGSNGTLWADVDATCVRLVLGFVFGALAGLVLGALVGFFETLEWLIDPMIQSVRSVPSLAWVPLFILWMGIGEGSKITLIAVGVFFPVYLATMNGIRYVDRKLLEVGQVFRFPRWKLIWRITIPSSLPAIFTGLRAGLGLGWMFVVAAELMGASQGLGYLLETGQNTYAPELIVGSIVLFAILGKVSDGILRVLERRLLHWHDSFGNRETGWPQTRGSLDTQAPGH
ncbi:ABC transporter permease [Alicyclobacillus shizuokensis]|uniref:ABC transporter permease n=1 Tax=Alicyclobacillus shizuokensis TaxID=392014 RepID=UPI0009F8E403|nr:ABC transporter permease [Alicyclobacillus shizuokensis]